MPGMRTADSPPVRRDFDLREVKAIDQAQGTFSGYLSVFEVTDHQGDVVCAGAFTKTLQELRTRQQKRSGTPGGRYLFPILFNHDSSSPCGGCTEAYEDAHGLFIKGELDLNTTLGRDAWHLIASGVIPAMSIGYFVVRYAYDRNGTRLLKELALFEGSLVANPACDDAIILEVKSANGAKPMEIKSASDDDTAAQTARSKKYGIAAKDGGSVTKPSKYSKLSDDDFADPVNYSYPLDTKAHADNAASRFGDPDNRSVYSSKEQGIISDRIKKAQAKFGEDDEGDESKSLDIADDGSHAAFTGTHTHAHSAFSSQGDDDMHSHEHTHDGDATHDHTHGKSLAHPAPKTRQNGKALDFTTAYAQVSQDDSLQDEWGDTMQALVNALYSTMCIGNLPGDSGAQDTADTILKQFSDAMSDLVKRSLAAVFTPCLDDDCDTFLDPDAVGDYDDGTDSELYMSSLDTAQAGAKAARVISKANATAMQKALDMVYGGHSAAAKGMQQARAGHKQATALLKAMAAGKPDEATTEDDLETTYNGPKQEGVNDPYASKSMNAPGAPTTSDTTQQAEPMTADDLSKLIARKMRAKHLAATVMSKQQSA